MYMAVTSKQLIQGLKAARARTLELVHDLSAEQLIGPRLDTVNPLRWEIGHAGYFHEFWILRHLEGRNPILPDADEIFDSIDIPHEVRWDLSIPSFEDTLGYLQTILEAEMQRLEENSPNEQEAYFYRLATYHEDMHTEAFSYTRQTLAYPEPVYEIGDRNLEEIDTNAGPLPGDVQIPGGRFMLGAGSGEEFVFDNEKWAHEVEVKPYRIARAAVTNEEYIKFVDASGYTKREFWCDDGWQWRESFGLRQPIYWLFSKTAGWQWRRFDEIRKLSPYSPVIHVSWYEAQAYCRWAGRRLPSEVEWELAAAGEPDGKGGLLPGAKRRFPWGDQPPQPQLANLDGQALGCIDVGALPLSDSAFGCRQMIGNVWEWTDSVFQPYPGFTPDPYEQYSQPMFGITRVLRGGCWATRGHMLRNTWRNYYPPERDDVFAGFRTCAL